MSSGFRVVMSDLLSVSEVFGRQSQTLRGVVSDGGPPPADGGDSTIDDALSAALRAALLTTRQLAAVADDHSQKLRSAYNRYHKAEEASTQLCQQLTKMAES